MNIFSKISCLLPLIYLKFLLRFCISNTCSFLKPNNHKFNDEVSHNREFRKCYFIQYIAHTDCRYALNINRDESLACH